MIKLYITDSNNWIIDLLRQYFDDLEEANINDSDIQIQNHESNISFFLTKNNQSWELKKPLKVSQLINTLEQAKQELSNFVINIGPIEFHPNTRLCLVGDEQFHLTQKETEILICLANNNALDKTSLLHKVWGYSEEADTNTLETHVYRLRNKFAHKYEIISIKNSIYILNL